MTQEEYLEKRKKVVHRKRIFGFDYRNFSMSASEFVEKMNKILESYRDKCADIEFIADDSDENSTSIYLTWIDWETFEQADIRLRRMKCAKACDVAEMKRLIERNEQSAVDVLLSLGYKVEKL